MTPEEREAIEALQGAIGRGEVTFPGYTWYNVHTGKPGPVQHLVNALNRPREETLLWFSDVLGYPCVDAFLSALVYDKSDVRRRILGL